MGQRSCANNLLQVCGQKCVHRVKCCLYTPEDVFVTGGCGDPGELTNGMLIFSNGTRDGSVVTFQCDPGLSLVGDRVFQCRSGQWTVLPQDVLCTADTSVPTSPGELMRYVQVTTLCVRFLNY